MLSVALHTLRTRWAAFTGSFVALALGVALLAVMGQALAASLDVPGRAPERFAAAPVVVQGQDVLRVTTPAGERTARLAGPRPVPARTVSALRALGPVTEDRSFPVRTSGAHGVPPGLVGHPWPTARFAPYALTAGRAPEAADEVVVSGDWTAVGARLPTVDGPLRVVGTVRALGFENAVFYTADRAARLSPAVVQLVVEADAGSVRAAVADNDVRVLTGGSRRLADADPGRDAEALTALNALFGTAGGVSAFVSVFVVAATFAFAVDRRRREFGLLRVAGATPGQVRRTVLAEALAVGVLASAAGCAMGAYAAPLLGDLVASAGLAPRRYTVGGPGAGVWPYRLAFWTGLSVALGGALAASWRAGRTAPAQALREAAADGRALTRGRSVCGAALLLTAGATLAYALATDPGDLLHRKTYVVRPMLLITAVALLAPALLRPLLPRLPGVVGLLARAHAVAGIRRSAAVAAPVLVTVALAGSLLGATATLDEARSSEARRQTAADFVVTPRDGATLPPGDVERLRRVPGTLVSATAATSVHTLEDGVALVKSGARAADPRLLAKTERLPVTAGEPAGLDDDSIVVTREWARHRVGQRVPVWLADGTAKTLRIVAVLAVGTGENGAYVTPANAGGAGVDRVAVRVRPGADRAAVAAGLRTVRGVRVMDAEQWARAGRPRSARTTLLGLLLVLGIALVYTGISLANTLVMAAAERRPALRALRLTGATPAQILRLAATETLSVVAAGAVLGLLVTAVNLAGMSAALRLLSAPPAFVVPWTAIAGTTGACALLALTASLITTATALRGTARTSGAGRGARPAGG
ncbi:FtsX-like permease family protein [Streptomyces sp. NPDC048481]|uniref:ABC transporter permease n=1 Tax=Streptomyces sp. NPDC048481 TaxID=3365557 RepID=UPI00371A8C2E